MEEAERLNLITPVASASREDRFTFAHQLIRQTLVSGLSHLRRRRLHLRIAEAIETVVREDPEVTRVFWLVGGSFPRVYYNVPMDQDNSAHFAQAIVGTTSDAATKRVLDGLQHRDLRRTAMVRMAEAGCTTQQIAAVSGHEIATTTRILDTYIPRTAKMAEAAILKWEGRKGNKSGNDTTS